MENAIEADVVIHDDNIQYHQQYKPQNVTRLWGSLMDHRFERMNIFNYGEKLALQIRKAKFDSALKNKREKVQSRYFKIDDKSKKEQYYETDQPKAVDAISQTDSQEWVLVSKFKQFISLLLQLFFYDICTVFEQLIAKKTPN